MSQVLIGDILPRTQVIATIGQVTFGTNWTANYASDVVVYSRAAGVAANDLTQVLSYPSQYSVAFIGDQLQVQVTLVTPSTAGDIVTVVRNTPANRENLYSNTNFLPTMLNNDFGILTLVDQQAQLVDQLVGPRYNYSAIINPRTLDEDTILPILPVNCTWIKNPTNTAIITYELPADGIAPANATYITVTDETATLPNSSSLADAGEGIMVSGSGPALVVRTITGTNNQIVLVNGSGVGGNPTISIAPNPIIPGTAGMGIPEGTTGQRVTPSSGIGLRYNTTNAQIEYWTGTTWAGLTDNGLTHNFIFVGDASGNASEVAMSGDATIVDTGAVTVSKIGGVDISLEGSFTTVGAFPVIFNFTAPTDVTFPTSGTLATTTTPSSTSVIVDDTTTNATMYPLWVTAATGSLPLKVSSTKYSFNPSTGTLSIAGNLQGSTGITSSAGIYVVQYGYTPSAVNYFTFTNNTTGMQPALDAVGTDGSVGLAIRAKNAFVGIYDNTNTIATPLRFYNVAGNYAGFKAPTVMADTTWIWPGADAAGQLTSDGAGNLSFSNVLSGAVLLNPAADQSIIAHNLFLTNGGLITGGATAALTPLLGSIQAVRPGNSAVISSQSFVNTAGGPSFAFYKSRNSTPGSHTTVAASDSLGVINVFGDDGTSYTLAGRIALQATGTISAGIVPGVWTFSTANAAGSITSAMTIDSTQLVTALAGLKSNTYCQSLTGFVSGASTGGSAGDLLLYTPTTAKGYIEITAANNAGNFGIQITNASFGQASVLTIPDPGSATANFALSKSPTAWTPVVDFLTHGDLSVSYAVQVGNYVKIGNMVIATYNVTFTPTYTTASSSFFISLPITPANNAYASVNYSNVLLSVGYTSVIVNAQNDGNMYVYQNGTGQARTDITTAVLTSGSAYSFYGTIIYMI